MKTHASEAVDSQGEINREGIDREGSKPAEFPLRQEILMARNSCEANKEFATKKSGRVKFYLGGKIGIP